MYAENSSKKSNRQNNGLAGSWGGGSVVPEVGLEPTRSKGTLDFESSASTNSTTPAPEGRIRQSLMIEGLAVDPEGMLARWAENVKVRKRLT